MERPTEGLDAQLHDVQHLTTRDVVSFTIRLLVGLAILFILFQLVSISSIIQTLRQARKDFIGAALLLLLANVGLQVWKWHYLLRLAFSQTTVFQSLSSFLFGVTLGSFTPGQLGEFGGRALAHKSLPAIRIIHLTLLDKFQILLVITIGGIAACAILFLSSAWSQTILVALSTSSMLLLFFRPTSVKPLLQAIIPERFFARWFREFFDAVELLAPKDLLRTFTLTLLFYLVLVLQMFFLLNAFTSVGVGDAALGFGAMMFAKSLLPISLADLGIREAGSIYFYGRLGIPESAAFNASVLLFSINILLPSLIGLFFQPTFSFKNKEKQS